VKIVREMKNDKEWRRNGERGVVYIGRKKVGGKSLNLKFEIWRLEGMGFAPKGVRVGARC
jgi:hypothetical protein